MFLSSVPLIALLASAVVAGPTGLRSTCVETCEGGSNFLYRTGLKYEYAYEVDAVSSSADADSVELKVSALVSIQAVKPCEFSLTLSEVTLPGSSNSDEFASSVTKNSLRFSFQNGKVEHLCADEDELTWVLNFKKGILSHFQNSLIEFEGEQQISETDINGICDTSYKVEQNDDEDFSYLIKKEKTLTDCQQGSNLKATLLSLGFERDYSDVNQAVDARSTCEQRIIQGIFIEINCTQKFSWQAPQIVHDLETRSTLKFLQTRENVPKFLDFYPVRSNLLFQEDEKKVDISYVEDLLFSIKAAKEVVQKDTPRLFYDLVKALGSMTFEELETLNSNTKDEPTHKFFYDALLLVGTPEAMKMIIHEKIHEVDMNIWLTSLSLLKTPTLPMFDALSPLVLNDPNPKAMLAISSLVHNYCSKDNECHLRHEIQLILRSIESYLGTSCRSNTENEKSNILIALKSLGNAGRWINAGDALKRCYMENNPMEIRITAIEAWRRAPCEHNRDHLLSTYYDEAQDSEVRIAAYLAIMRCPSESLVDAIKDRLTSEGVNQVGSFVWSHLSNFQESAAPDKQWIRNLIGEELLQKKFSSEALKFSRYYESSFYMNELKVGGSAEADMIFSQSSFLPRSAMMNLTVDVFGVPLNLLEIGGRMKGFEAFIERFFGPDGYYPDATIEAILKNMRESKEKETNGIEDPLDDSAEPEGSLFVKLFGNELFYHNFHGTDNIMEQLGFSNPLEMILEIFRKGKSDFTKSFNILDKTVTFPSIIGFPVNLKLKSSATISLQVEGSVDIRSFTKMEVLGTFKPSASITTDSSMEIDAFVTRSGTIAKRTAHTATKIGGRAFIEGLRLIEFKLDIPEKEMEIYSTSHEFYLVQDGIEIKVSVGSGYTYRSCGSILPNIYSYCFEEVSNGYLVPASIKYTLNTESSYVFRAKFNDEGNYYILFDMPGTDYNNNLMISLTHDRNTFDVNLISPWLNLKSNGRFELEPTEIKVNGEILVNDRMYYSISFSNTLNLKEAGLVFAPKLVLRDSTRAVVHLEGDLNLDWGFKRVSLFLHTDGIVGKRHLRFTSNLNTERPTTTLEIDSDPFKMKAHGSMILNPDRVEFNTEGTFSLFNSEPKSLDTSFKIARQGEAEEELYTASISTEFLQFSADWETKFVSAGVSNKGNLKYEDCNFRHENHLLYTTVEKTRKLDLRFFVHCPQKPFTILIEKKVEFSDKHIKTDANFEIGSVRGSHSLYGEYWKYIKQNGEIFSNENLVYSTNVLVEQKADGRWIVNYDALDLHMDFTFHDKSVIGESFDYIMNGEVIISSFGEDIGNRFSSSFKASRSMLDLEGTLVNVVTNTNHFILAKASHSEVAFSSNIYRPFSIIGKFVPNAEGKEGFEFKASVDTEEIFNAFALYSDRSVEASLRYSDIDLSFLVSLLDSGIETSVRWSPTERIAVLLQYETGEGISLLASAQTPFEGWEKQELQLSFGANTLRNVYGQISVTWDNVDHLTITITNKLESILDGHKYHGLLRITSSLEQLEIVSLELNHEMTSNQIITNVEYKFNGAKMDSELKAFKSESGYDASYSLKCPRLDIIVESDLTITIRPRFVSFTANAKGSMISEIRVKGSFERSDLFIDLNLTGRVDDKTISLNANGRKEPEIGSCKMTLKFVSPFTNEFDLNYSHKISQDKTLEVDFDMPSFKYPGEKYKIHVIGKLSDLKNMFASWYINGPNLAGKVTVNNHFTNGRFKTLLDANIDHHSLILNVDGNINRLDYTGSFNLETKSTLISLNEIKMTFHHALEREGRSTNLILNKGEFNAKAFAFYKDYSNLEFKFDANDQYKLHLRNTFDPYPYTGEHSVEFVFDQVIFKLLTMRQYESAKLEFFLESPWTRPVNFVFSVRINEGLPAHDIIFSVPPFKFIGKSMVYDRGFIANGDLSSDYWSSPFTFDIKVLQDIRAKIKVFNLLEINVDATKGPDGIIADFSIKGEEINLLPILIKFNGVNEPNLKKMLFIFRTNQDHEIIFDISKTERDFSLSADISLPNIINDPFKADFEYKYHDRYDLEFTLVLAGKSYALRGTLESDNLNVLFIHPRAEGSLLMDWDIQEFEGRFEITCELESYVLAKHDLKMDYNLKERSASLALKCNGKMFTFASRNENNSYIIDITTPIEEWENLSAAITYKRLFMDIQLLKNGKEFRLHTEGNFESTLGHGELLISTPIANYQLNKMSFKYTTSQKMKEILVSGNVGEKELEFENSVTFSDNLPKVVLKFNIKSFFDKQKDLSFEINFDETSISKTITVNGSGNDKHFNWTFQIHPSRVNFELTSNNPGWRTFELKGTCEKTDESIKAKVNVITESYDRTYSIYLRNNNEKFKLEVKTPIPEYRYILIDGKYEYINEVHKISADLRVNEKEYTLFGEGTSNPDKPKFEFVLKKERDQSIIECVFNGQFSLDRQIDFSIKLPDSEYKGRIHSLFTYDYGRFESSFVLPFIKFSELIINGNYNFRDTIKAELDFIQDGNRKHFVVEGRMNPNNRFNIDVITPFKGFEKLNIDGHYNVIHTHSYFFESYFHRNEVKYRFSGNLMLKDEGLSIETTIPYQYGDELLLFGDIYKNSLTLRIISKLDLFKPHEINLQYNYDYVEAFMKLETTFDSVRNLEIFGTQIYLDGTVSGAVRVILNDKKLNLEAKLKCSNYDSLLMFSTSTSDPEETYYFKSYLNLINNEKTMGIIFTSPSLSKELTLTSNYQMENPYKATIVVTTSVPDFKKFGLSYDFFVSSENREYGAYLKLMKNDDVFSFGAQGLFNDKRMMTKILLPFENYEIISFDGFLDIQESRGMLSVQVGEWAFNFEASFDLKNSYILISTPYEELRNLNLIAKYEWTSEEKVANLKYEYNDIVSQLYLNLPTSTKSELNFKIATPFKILKAFEVIGGFNPQDYKEIVKLGFTYNDIKYFISTGYNWSGCEGNVNLKLMTPFSGYTDVLFEGAITLGKSFSIFLQRDGDKYDILIKGHYSDEEISFGLETPFEATSNFRGYGTYSRSKRSLDVMMMNDKSQGGIVAKFNSLKIILKSPFEKLSLVEFEIAKPKKGGFIFNYKRNEHYINFSVTKNNKKKGFDIAIKSAIPGWEFLALTGRLDEEELFGHLSGTINEKQLTISGNGLFLTRTGKLNIEILTPYVGYEKITVNVNYNARRKEFSIKAKSSTNKDFKITLEFKRGLFIKAFIPHEERNTEINGRLTIYKGTLDIKSRFALIRSYSLKYGIELRKVIKAYFTINRNDIKRFDFQFEENVEIGLGHFMVMISLLGNKSMFHYHRDALRSLEISFSRNDKEIKLEASSSGDIPETGKIDFTITNSFRAIPVTVIGDIVIDRTGSPKEMTMNVRYSTGKLYTLYLKYNIDLQDISKGNYTLKINTPNKMAAPWKSISGKWEIDDDKQGLANVKVGPFSVTATGIFGLGHSDLTFDHNIPNLESLYLGWKFLKNGYSRDYYLKVGRENRYVMAKFKGQVKGINRGDITGEFRTSKYMDNDFVYALKWKKEGNKLSGGGTFEFGDHTGHHTLHYFRRNAAERAAEFKWEAFTNIEEYTNIILKGEYSLAQRMLDFILEWDTDNIAFKGTLENFSREHSDNTITGHLPVFGDGHMRITHNFSNPLDKSISAVGVLGSKRISYDLHWTRNKECSVLNLIGNIDSAIIGLVNVNLSYDISYINNANLVLKYTRNNDKFINIDWSRKMDKYSLKHLLTIKSHFECLPSLKAYIIANWESGFSYVDGIEYRGKVVKSTVTVGKERAELSFQSPFSFIDDISAVANYKFKSKSNSFNLQYKRGDVAINLDFDLKIVNRNTGSLKLSIDTPYSMVRTFSIDAEWKNGKVDALYKRNDIEMSVTGKAKYKSGKLSFDISFTPPGRSPVDLKLDYDIEAFKSGKGESQNKLLDFQFGFAGQTGAFVVNGYRNSRKINLEITGNTSFKRFKTVYVLLDSELNLRDREGRFIIKVDDFEFDIRNTLTSDDKQNFYFESHISSTLTRLPGIKIGFGRQKSSFILTLGVGDNKEITITFKGKDNFRKGFVGKLDLPHMNLKNVAFDVGYSFKGENKLEVDLVVDLGNGNKIECDLIYNSDGVKSRLSSPWTGPHSLRLRRSISDGELFAEVGIDDYNCQFHFLKYLNRGYIIEGELLGKKFKLDVYLEENFQEGRLIINTPFLAFETFGGQYIVHMNGPGEFTFNAVLQLYLKIVADLKFNIYRGLNVDAHLVLGNEEFKASISTNQKGGTLEINAGIDLPYYIDPIEFSFIGHSVNSHYFDGSINLRGIFGSHVVDFSGTDYYGLIEMNVRANSRILIEEFKVSLNLRRPFNLFEFSSKEFTIIFNHDVNDDNGVVFKCDSKVLRYGKILYDINMEVSTTNTIEFNIDATLLEGIYKFSSNMNYSPMSRIGKGYMKYAMNPHTGARFIIEKNKEEVLAEFTYMNNETLKVRANFKFPEEGKELSLDCDSSVIPRMSFKYVRMPERPFKISLSLETTMEAYTISLTTDLRLSEGFLSQENAFLKAELLLPASSLPYSLDLKQYNQENIKGFKVEVCDGGQVHTLSGKLSNENYSGKIYLLADSPLLYVTNKAYFNLAYDFGENFKIYIEVMENNKVSHSLFLDLNPSEQSLFVNLVSPCIYSGLLKLEAKVNKFSSTEGDAQLTIRTAISKLSAKMRGKMLENEVDVYVSLNTPFEGFELVKFGGKYLKGSLTKVLLFAEPYNFKASSSFGVVDSTIKFGVELKADIDSWRESSIEINFPLNTFNPRVALNVGNDKYGLALHYDRTPVGGGIGYNVTTPFKEAEFALYYRSKAPFELGFKSSVYEYNYHVMFDSSFLVFSDAAMILF